MKEWCFYLTICVSGIIESDDIQFVNTEVDKALNFSRKVALLIDNVKKKYHNRFVSLVLVQFTVILMLKTHSSSSFCNLRQSNNYFVLCSIPVFVY